MKSDVERYQAETTSQERARQTAEVQHCDFDILITNDERRPKGENEPQKWL